MVVRNPPLHIYTSSLSRRQRAWVRARRRRALGRLYFALVFGAVAAGVAIVAVLVLAAS